MDDVHGFESNAIYGEIEEQKHNTENQDPPKLEQEETMDDVRGFESNTMYGEIEEILDSVDWRFRAFKKFDIVSEPPFDHHFIYHKKLTRHAVADTFRTNPVIEKLQQEWKMLETGLPDYILVRAYKNRVDLMRAVVIGPPGTPYYNGLFFFDILFPSNYPACPPKFFYRSLGFDLNPNLRPEGKVHLNLLETWCGRMMHSWHACNTEKWNPNHSNILQVLDSIRCLVLKTRYNNKNAFMLTCEAMVRTLDMPPMDFEDFVAGHFRQRAHEILMNYKAQTDQSERMTQLFLKLFRVFEANGAYCKHHCGVERQLVCDQQRQRQSFWVAERRRPSHQHPVQTFAAFIISSTC